MYISMGVITVIGVFFASIYVPLYFTNAFVTISTKTVSKHSGFFIKSNQTMKISSIQYITAINIPLFKYIGFNFLILSAFGGNLILIFLKKDDCKELYENIVKRISTNF